VVSRTSDYRIQEDMKMGISEKVAYLKGLVEGMKLDTEKEEGKILAGILDVLEDMALEIEDLWDDQSELSDGLDVVSDDLEMVEEIVYDDEEDDEYLDDEEDEDSEDCYATTCPTCEETIYFDESVLEDGEVICPNCGERLEFDMTSLDEDGEDGEE